GSTVFVSETASPRWRLRVAGRPVARHLAFGWANSFSVPPAAAGRARLTYRTSPFRYGAIGLEVALWIVAVRLSVARRRGGAGAASPLNGTIIVANPTGLPVHGTLTVVPAGGGAGASAPVEVGPASASSVVLAGLTTATYAGVVVQLDGGQVVVEHKVAGPA